MKPTLKGTSGRRRCQGHGASTKRNFRARGRAMSSEVVYASVGKSAESGIPKLVSAQTMLPSYPKAIGPVEFWYFLYS